MIKSQIVEQLLDTPQFFLDMQIEYDCSHETVRRWFREENWSKLTRPGAMRIIRKHTKLTDSEILEPAKA